MSYILHLDTATDRGFYFLAKDGHILLQKDSGDNRDHAATLPGIVADLLHAAGLTFRDIDAFAVNGGPGSYTGLRISLAAAKGYCFALQKPLLLAHRLLLLLYTLRASHPEKDLLAVLPARVGEYFAAAMKGDGKIFFEPQHFFAGKLSERIADLSLGFAAIGTVATDFATLVPDIMPPIYASGTWAGMTYEKFLNKDFSNLSAAEPYYLKEAFTTQPRKIKQ